MISRPAIFSGEIATGKDELGNAITEPFYLGVAMSRIAKWSREDIDLLGRELTARTVKLVTHAKLPLIEETKKVSFMGTDYRIDQVNGSDFDRWRILFLERVG